MFLLARQVEGPPGFIVGPIARLFGFVINALFNVVSTIGEANSLGFTIILMTIVFQLAMMPLTLKGQKSMVKMREIKPELDKIQEKYGKTKDPELMRKMNAEKQALMAKHGANPLSGCVPMLIQMPLFIGLAFIMRQAFLYITRLRDMYYELAEALIEIPGLVAGKLQELANPLISDRMQQNGEEIRQLLIQWGYTDYVPIESWRRAVGEVGEAIFLYCPEDLSRVLNRFSLENWETLYEYIHYDAIRESIQGMVAGLHQIEGFFGLHLVENSGLGWPGIIIPILTAVTMIISTWLMQQRTNDPNADDRTRMTQKMMLFVMPLMMGWFTINFPAGVGLFWITSQVFRGMMDIIWLKKDKIPIQLPFAKAKT